MKVEEIAVRQEVRQMMSEAGINKETMKTMVKDVISEEMQKAIKQAFHETNMVGIISDKVKKNTDEILRSVFKEEVRQKVNDTFNHMRVQVDITDKYNNSIVDKRGE